MRRSLADFLEEEAEEEVRLLACSDIVEPNTVNPYRPQSQNC
jgi:hypothetical protein